MVLLVLAVEAGLLALALWRSPANALANRLLAGLLLVIAGMLTPFILGYAGAYDAWPWLSFAPFSVALAVGPLLYGHCLALAEGRRLAAWHAAAPAAQFLNQALVFPWPVATKTWWDTAVQEPWLSPVISLAVLVSMAGYGWAAFRTLGRYDAWLAARRRDRAPARRLRVPVAALALLLVARAGYEVWDLAIARVDYFDLFAYYLLLGVLAVWIGITGWRAALLAAPPIVIDVERDWVAQGRIWLDRLRVEGWWRDPGLDLAGLARHLGSNESQVSRALNAAGAGFAGELAGIRAEAVAARLAAGDGDDLLVLALGCGFGSKASFNRAFRARFGTTPSAWRAAHAQTGVADPASLPAQPAMRRGGA